MYSRILLPVDGSTAAESAVDRALDIALTVGANVHVLTVSAPGPEVVGIDPADVELLQESADLAASEAVDRVHRRVADVGLEVTRASESGVPHREIVEYAKREAIDLVVMGTHGHTGPERVRLGSTTEQVVTMAETPVLTVPMAARGDVDALAYDRILLATDGSDVADRAAEQGIDFATAYGSSVDVVYVIDSTTYDLQDAPRSIVGLLKEGGRNAVEETASLAREEDVSANVVVLRGQPEAELLEYADGIDADLVVLGTRGRGETPRSALGSTTARVLRRIERPTLTVN